MARFINQLRAWLRRLGHYLTGRPTSIPEEDWSLTSDKVTYTELDHKADAHGFEYACYRLTDPFGTSRIGYCRVIPTTYLFTCPDCGGMVVGVDTPRVRPGGTGPDPVAFVCERCGRREDRDFGIPRIEYQQGTLTFEEPRGLEPLCPQGGAHQWRLLESWTEMEPEPGSAAGGEGRERTRAVEHRRWVCDKCGQVRS